MHAEHAVKFCACILSVRLKAIIFNIKKRGKILKIVLAACKYV
jgi:hypothetical protein